MNVLNGYHATNNDYKDVPTSLRPAKTYEEPIPFTFVDLFAGIGGFRLGLESIGGNCIASSEINKNALDVYGQNWPDDPSDHNLGDICEIKSLPAHDLLVGGVPCQSWSIAGKNRGIDDPRGKLWNEVIRLLHVSQPTAFLFENVKGLIDPRHREALQYLVDSFSEVGYDVYYRLLNAYDYGVPQNRNRIFIVGIKKGMQRVPFVWPAPVAHTPRLHEILDDIEVNTAVSTPLPLQRNLFGERINVQRNRLTPAGSKNKFFILTDIRNGATSIHSWDIYDNISEREKTICLTLLKNRRKSQYGPKDGNPLSLQHLQQLIPDLVETELQTLVDKNVLRYYPEQDKYEFFNRKLSGGIDGVYRVYLPSSTFFPTLMASGTLDFVATIDVQGESEEAYRTNFVEQVLNQKKYRSLKPVEMARLQGFPNEFVLHENEAKNTQLFGNSVAVPVVRAIGLAIRQTGCFHEDELCPKTRQ